MTSYGMFSHVSREPGTLVHKAVGDPGAKYDSPNGGVGAGVGFDGSMSVRCTKERLPAYGTAERSALDPPEDSALRWGEVTCPACLDLKFTAPPLVRDKGAWCACGHDEAKHYKGTCLLCDALNAQGACDREV